MARVGARSPDPTTTRGSGPCPLRRCDRGGASARDVRVRSGLHPAGAGAAARSRSRSTRRSTPSSGACSTATAPGTDRSAPSDETVVAIGVQMIAAGYATSADALGTAIHRLATDPDIQMRLRRSPEPIPAVDELLRLETPCRSSAGAPPATSNGTAGRSGPASTSRVNHTAANRDPGAFEHPAAASSTAPLIAMWPSGPASTSARGLPWRARNCTSSSSSSLRRGRCASTVPSEAPLPDLPRPAELAAQPGDLDHRHAWRPRSPCWHVDSPPDN